MLIVIEFLGKDQSDLDSPLSSSFELEDPFNEFQL